MSTIYSRLEFKHKPKTKPKISHYTYILSGKAYGPIFFGTTANLKRRLTQHRFGHASIAKFRIDQLVHLERHDSIEAATTRADALKAASREWIDALVERKNPDWGDLFEMAKKGRHRAA